MTSAELARELEVARRTILRDIDALTEAGLPIIVHRGNQGGVELGFNYRTRLTGLAADEAEAIAIVLTRPLCHLAQLGIADAAVRARRKLIESFPDQVRERIATAMERFRFAEAASTDDTRLAALADAIRDKAVVRINAFQSGERTIHPVALVLHSEGWCVEDALASELIDLDACGDINVSARTFARS